MDSAGLTSTVTGEVERGGDASILRGIHVQYRLSLAAESDRARVDRALGFHAQHCGVYRSLHRQITITTDLELIDG